MRKLRKWLHLLLVICLIAGSILPYLPAMKLTVSAQETDGSGSGEGTTTTVNKFYVDGVGSNSADGSKDKPFETLAEAYSLIPEDNEVTYIVVCGEVTLIKGAEQSGTAKHYTLPKHNGKVVITSVYGEENYKTQGAKLNLSDNIYLLGDTVFENIKFSGTATQFNANYFSLHFSEGIETENDASIATYIRMGTSNKMKTMGSESVDYIKNGTITARDVTLTIDSGSFEKVFGRSYDYQGVNAKENSITVNVNGGTIVDLCGSNVRKDTGKEAASVTVNVAGDAKITNLYGAGVGAIINGDVKVNVKGGTITNLYGVGEFHASANTEYPTEIRGNVEVWLQGGTVTNVQGIQDDDTVSGNVTVAGDTIIHVGSETAQNISSITMPTVKDFTALKLSNCTLTVPTAEQWIAFKKIQLTDNSLLKLEFVPTAPTESIAVVAVKSGTNWQSTNPVIQAPTGTANMFTLTDPLDYKLAYTSDTNGVYWTLENAALSIGEQGTEGRYCCSDDR